MRRPASHALDLFVALSGNLRVLVDEFLRVLISLKGTLCAVGRRSGRVVHEVGNEVLHHLILRDHVPLKIEHLANDLLVIARQGLQVIVHATLHRLHGIELTLQRLDIAPAVVIGAIHDRTRLNLLRMRLGLWHPLCRGCLPLDVVERVAIVYVELGVLELPGALPVWVAFQRLIRLSDLVKIVSMPMSDITSSNVAPRSSVLVQLTHERSKVRVFEMSRQNDLGEFVRLRAISAGTRGTAHLN